MTDEGALGGLAAHMRASLGMVIPVWFPSDAPEADTERYLATTLEDVELYAQPRNVLLVVDGCPHAVAAARAAAGEVGRRTGESCRVLSPEANEGKGGAVASGLEALLEAEKVAYFVVRDCDGDHDTHDAVRLFRRTVSTCEREGTENVFATGSRPVPHLALGWARGEYELLLNEALVEACNAHLATEGRRVDLRYSLPALPYPDFQSGYKLYTRRTARANVEAIRRAHDREPDAEVKRWGSEFVTVTELLLQGAIPVEVSRLTYDEQPQTTFDESNRVHAFGRQLVWLFRRLGTPPAVARHIIDNALARSPLRLLAGGWEELLRFREHVRLGAYPSEDWGLPPTRGELL